jgi:hypothetical protein
MPMLSDYNKTSLIARLLVKTSFTVIRKFLIEKIGKKILA